jgi:acyl carrier protein
MLGLGVETMVTSTTILTGTVWDQVSQVVAASAKVKPPYTGGEHLYNELGLESVQALNLLLALEERFGVTLNDQEFIRCTTVASLAELIEGTRR